MRRAAALFLVGCASWSGRVSFQQSQVRGGNFNGANLLGASFFDATLTDSSFVGANMNQVC
jgi:uncharacterized protein YjbI with pentapeptide repeats